MGCPDYVKVEYKLPKHNNIKDWQSKTVEQCERYVIDRQGQLFIAGTIEDQECLLADFHNGLFEIHSYDKDMEPISYTFTFKDGIVQSVQPGRLYG